METFFQYAFKGLKRRTLVILLLVFAQLGTIETVKAAAMSAVCSSPTLNTGTTSITPSTSWQTVVMATGAVRYVPFTATAGVTYVFTTYSSAGGSSSVDEQFSMLTSAGAASTGVYSTSYKDGTTSVSAERFIWSPSSTGTYWIVLAKKSGGSNCVALTSNVTVAYTSFTATENFSFWTGFSSTTFGTAANWFTRAAASYPTETAPTASYDVIIPSGSSNQPNCGNVAAEVKNLTINSGATLSMNYSTLSLNVAGNLLNNGTINHSGTIYIYLSGSGKTIGGTGNFFAGAASPFNIEPGASYTLQNNITVRHFYVDITGSFDMNGYDITTEFLFQEGTLYLRAGNLNIWGNPDASMWANPGDDINPYFSTDGNFVPGTGTVFYCQGDSYTASNQTIRTTTYYNLKINTQSTKTATIGTSGAITVSNDFTLQNSSTAGGVATLAQNVTVAGNLNIGATGNALTLNLPYRMYRSSGNGTLTMGDVAAHAINITYAHASNLCITGFGTPTFHGVVTYNSASAQMVTGATYDDLAFTGAGTKTLAAAIDVDEILTLSAGTLDVASGSNYAISLEGDFVRADAAVFTCRSGTITFNGSATQRINVTAAAGTTPANSDITFYNVIVDGTDAKFYYDATNSRKLNMNDFTVNSSKSFEIVSN